MARVKSQRERKDEYIAEQEALTRLGRSQSGVKFPPVLPTWEDLATKPMPGTHFPAYGEPEPPLGPIGPRQTPAQAGVGLGNIFADFLANMPKGSVAQNVAATTMGAQADGIGQLVEAVSGTMQGQTPPMSVFQHQDVSNDLKAAGLDSPWGALQQTRETQSPAEIYGANANVAAKAKTAEAQLQAFTGSVTGQQDSGYTTAKQANAAIKLKSLLSSGRPMGVQEIADLVTDSRTASSTYGKFPGELRAESYETGLRLNALQKEKIKTMNPADFQNYGDAFQHAQLNGMNPSESLKFASDWSKIAPQGQQSSSQAAPRSAGTPQTNEQFRDSLHASNKRAAEVAQAVRDGIRARQAPPSATAPSGDPAAAPAAAPTTHVPKRVREEALDNQTATLNDLKIDSMQLDNVSKRLKQPGDAIMAALHALSPEQRTAFRNIKDADAKTDAMILIVNRFLAAGGRKAPGAK